MIDLLPHEHDSLRQAVRAGDEGVSITDVGVGAACRLELAGLATITKGPRQRVVATSQGAAFLRRDAHS